MELSFGNSIGVGSGSLLGQLHALLLETTLGVYNAFSKKLSGRIYGYRRWSWNWLVVKMTRSKSSMADSQDIAYLR